MTLDAVVAAWEHFWFAPGSGEYLGLVRVVVLGYYAWRYGQITSF